MTSLYNDSLFYKKLVSLTNPEFNSVENEIKEKYFENLRKEMEEKAANRVNYLHLSSLNDTPEHMEFCKLFEKFDKKINIAINTFLSLLFEVNTDVHYFTVNEKSIGVIFSW